MAFLLLIVAAWLWEGAGGTPQATGGVDLSLLDSTAACKLSRLPANPQIVPPGAAGSSPGRPAGRDGADAAAGQVPVHHACDRPPVP
jgi:hypothetical protein